MILRTLGEWCSDVDEGKRECIGNVKKDISALVTATLNIQELQGSPECARKQRARRQWFQVSIPSQNELHMTKVK